jgi:hypothetical protein
MLLCLNPVFCSNTPYYPCCGVYWTRKASLQVKETFMKVFIFICVLVLTLGSLAHAAPACSPKNYTKIKNTEPMPDDFCAYAYLPYRARMPEKPRHIDQTNTKILQQEYAPNSKPDDSHTNQLYTLGRKPAQSPEGNSNYPVYKASDSDPLVSVDCSKANTGCSNADYGDFLSSVPSFRIPAMARASGQFDPGDHNMEIIQPNGDTVAIYGCNPQRDWRHGDVVGDSSSICGRFGGASYGNIVTSSGVNPGNVNGGNNFAALPVHYREVMQGQINHALLVWAGCFTGAVYPAKWQALSCKNPPGIPSGAHIWLSLTRQQIDALPASVVPVHMRPFAYAAHEYGIYTMDTGDGKKWFGQPALEDSLPYVLSGGGTESYWAGWFKQHGGGMSGDANLKMSGRGNIIDWSALAPYLYVLDPCYAKGTCSDSVPEGAMSG